MSNTDGWRWFIREAQAHIMMVENKIGGFVKKKIKKNKISSIFFLTYYI